MDTKGLGIRTDLLVSSSRLDQLSPLSGSHDTQLNIPKADSDQEIKKAGQQFEALLMQSMFKSMWSTVPQNGLFSGSQEEAVYRDMFNEALAKDLAEHGSIGIADVISKDIKKLEKK